MKGSGETVRTAVLIPCFNEELTIGKVIDDFRRELPGATVVVVDNCSTDRSAAIAAERGAIVLREPRQGKGYVVDSMLARVDADLYVMVDGDDTYPAERVHGLLQPVLAGEADMCVGARLETFSGGSFRPLHLFGNKLVRFLVNWMAGTRLTDIMSGYRAFGRQVADRVPLTAAGFEVETEFTVQALFHRLRIVEVQVPYRPRREGSVSKLHTLRDGFRVLWTIFTLFLKLKPLTFFGTVGLLLFTAGLAAGLPPVLDWLEHRYVYRLPLAVLATGLMLLATGNVFLGLLLHALNWRFFEVHNVLGRHRVRSASRHAGASAVHDHR
jgi:glycosyltransferase involved in cell wall biosynthesis